MSKAGRPPIRRLVVWCRDLLQAEMSLNEAMKPTLRSVCSLADDCHEIVLHSLNVNTMMAVQHERASLKAWWAPRTSAFEPFLNISSDPSPWQQISEVSTRMLFKKRHFYPLTSCFPDEIPDGELGWSNTYIKKKFYSKNLALLPTWKCLTYVKKRKSQITVRNHPRVNDVFCFEVSTFN